MVLPRLLLLTNIIQIKNRNGTTKATIFDYHTIMENYGMDDKCSHFKLIQCAYSFSISANEVVYVQGEHSQNVTSK